MQFSLAEFTARPVKSKGCNRKSQPGTISMLERAHQKEPVGAGVASSASMHTAHSCGQ